MTARLLSLVAAAVFSFSVFAAEAPKTNEDQTLAMMKQLVACGEVKAAKHIALMVPMALAAAFSKSVAEDLSPYETAMAAAKSCADLDAAYVILAEVSKKNGADADVYFNSPEGKTALEELAAELRKLK